MYNYLYIDHEFYQYPENNGRLLKHFPNAIPLYKAWNSNYIPDAKLQYFYLEAPGRWYLLEQISDEDVTLLTLLGEYITRLPDNAHISEISEYRTKHAGRECRMYPNIPSNL